MTIRNILVPICPSISFEGQLNAALRLARPIEAHINAVYFQPDPVVALSSIPEVALAAGVTIDTIERDDRAAEEAAQVKFDSWRAENSVPDRGPEASLRSTYASWSRKAGHLETELVRRGRLSDLIVLNYPNPHLTASERAFDAVLFETGRPTVFVRDTVPDNLLRHVMIAWNGSLEATRAVAGAMTLLHEAEEVTIFASQNGAEESLGELDLAESLNWHGILARRVLPPPGSSSVGAGLLAAAQDQRATMIVMGAYTHGRVRQLLLGGVTAHVLRHSTIPCLMMH